LSDRRSGRHTRPWAPRDRVKSRTNLDCALHGVSRVSATAIGPARRTRLAGFCGFDGVLRVDRATFCRPKSV
jgi:hypothetical protein